MRHIIEQYEGYVLSVEEDTFWCRLYDFDEEEYQGEFYKKDLLLQADKDWLQEGAYLDLIVWNDGTADIWFIKEYWTKEDIEKAEERAKELFEYFKTAWKD